MSSIPCKLIAALICSGCVLFALCGQEGKLPSADEKKYAEGFRKIEGVWKSPDEIKALDAKHNTWSKAWELRTDHFAILSDAPYVEVELLSRKLEAYYRYFLSGYQKAMMLTEKKDMVVYYFSDAKDYLKHKCGKHQRTRPGGPWGFCLGLHAEPFQEIENQRSL